MMNKTTTQNKTAQESKTLDYYMSLPYRLEIVPDTEEGGFTAYYPELPGCATCGETAESVLTNALDAKKTWLTAALEDGYKIGEPTATVEEPLDSYSGQFKLRMPRSLHRRLAEQSHREGVSMNQYCVYLLSQNSAAAL